MNLFLIILIAIGITAIYDARKIAKKYFSNQDQNRMTKVLKALGFLISVISGILICVFNIKF